MALIVTPGATDADAFASFATVSAYATAKGLTWTVDATLGEPAIRRSTAYLSNSFTWDGLKTNGRPQALAWPRIGVADAEGWSVDSAAIPQEIVDACCEGAVYELANPGGLNPTVVLAERIKREKTGPLDTEYFGSTPNASDSKPILTLLEDMVSGLTARDSNPLVGTAVRR